jgi:hypothetical protein
MFFGGKIPQTESFTRRLFGLFTFYNMEKIPMVTGLRNKSTINLSTWGQRGTAGLVEEWESRIPVPEEKQQSRRRSAILTSESTASTTEGDKIKK